MDTPETLQSLCTQLAAGRQMLQAAQTHYQSAFEAFKGQEGVALLLESIDRYRLMLTEVEGRLRALALTTFAQTKHKQVADGVGIRVQTQYRYDMEVAIQWAQTHAPILLKQTLDTEGFLQLCKKENTRPDFVTAEAIPSVTIGKDLSSYLSTPPMSLLGETPEEFDIPF